MNLVFPENLCVARNLKKELLIAQTSSVNIVSHIKRGQ